MKKLTNRWIEFAPNADGDLYIVFKRPLKYANHRPPYKKAEQAHVLGIVQQFGDNHIWQFIAGDYFLLHPGKGVSFRILQFLMELNKGKR